MQPRMKLFLALSALALLVVVALPSKGAADAPSVAAASHPPVPAPETAPSDRTRSTVDTRPAADEPTVRLAFAEHLAALTWGRDPFLPPDRVHVYVEPEPEPLPVADILLLPALTGISHRAGSAMAILDQQVVAPGDRAGADFVVLAIEAGTVTLLRNGEQHILTLSEGR